MKKTTLFLTLVALIASCKKEEIVPKTITPQISLNTSKEDCINYNQRIISNIIDSISEYGSWRKSMAYYFHIKTRDSLSEIYNEKIAQTRAYESPQVYADPNIWEDAKFDMLDSMKIVWRTKEIIIDSETQQAIEKEINRRKQTGEIKNCDEDTYDPNVNKA